MDIQKIEHLLDDTSRILKDQEEKEKLKGEKFNVFSILKMESKENETHSAFLCELLNPKGSHLKGSIFLKLFLDVIKKTTTDNDTTQNSHVLPNPDTAQVKVEHYIGQRNDDDKTGGRIDIYIWDAKGNSISIENKIYADDQNVQLERYCNYNKGKNQVYYITLDGKEPTPKSKGNLITNTDYYNISYKVHIQEWLDLCLKESFDTPILRETIKQYLLLIKKLTFTMSNTEEKKLFDVIIKHNEEAIIIAANYKKAIASLLSEIRKKTYEKLIVSLQSKYEVSLGRDTNERYSQIWLKIAGKQKEEIFFGIQSFAVEPDDIGNLFIGIFVLNGTYEPKYAKLGLKHSNFWIEIHQYSDYGEYKVKFSDSKTLQKLNTDENFQNGFVKHIVEETINYLDKYFESVSEFL